MSNRTKKILISITLLLLVTYGAFRIIAPPRIEKSANKILAFTPLTISEKTKALHETLVIMDWHADTLLWSRDFLAKSTYGQVDFPRLKAGGMNIQMLTTVTKSPSGQNYESNTAEARDNITLLAIAQGWPIRSWTSLLERALYQADKLSDITMRSKGSVSFIKSKADLANHMASDRDGLGVLLGAEGAHPLEGKLENVNKLYDAGFRMVGLTHFFDNALGGSLHGTSKTGLTDFGRDVIKRLDKLEIIIDLAHASEAMAAEVTALSSRPQVISHTGLKGICDTPRNFNDALMQKIAAKGGLIGIGMWEAAVCDPTPTGIAKAIKYGIELVGADHIALGSDWDGAVEAMPANALAQITQALVNEGISEADIAKVMGGNSLKFLQAWLPAQ
jgi:membrane dipeptidase